MPSYIMPPLPDQPLQRQCPECHAFHLYVSLVPHLQSCHGYGPDAAAYCARKLFRPAPPAPPAPAEK